MKKRTKRVEVLLTQDEHKMLLERKTKPRLGEWIRETCLNEKPTKKPKPVDPRLLFELNKIGTNLNQIAKICNQSKMDLNTIEIALQLNSIDKKIKELIHDSQIL